MIRGFVNENDEPIVPIVLILKKKQKRFRAVLDTGFNGYLSVPQSVAGKSGWYFAGYEEYEIATGDRVKERVYLGEIVFDRQRFTTHVVTSHAKDVLIGTKLLSDKELYIDFKKRIVQIATPIDGDFTEEEWKKLERLSKQKGKIFKSAREVKQYLTRLRR